MKKIGIDARLYYQTGVGTYLRNLLHYLPKNFPISTKFFVYVLSKDVRKIHIPNDNFVIRGVDAPWHTVREQTAFYYAIMRDKLDLMHFTYFSYPVLYKRPFIATVHDVTPLLYKTGKASTLNPFIYGIKHQVFKFVLSQQVKNAKKIITPTYAVKDQLVEIYGKCIENKITPIFEGVSIDLVNASESTNLTRTFSKPFFLYVGNFYPHKNVDRLLEAYRLFCHPKGTEGPKDLVQLFLVGPDNMFAQKLKHKIKQEGIEGVKFYHRAINDDLVSFYKHAHALINPSLSEGFGLPLIEAMYFGCPVIASDIPVFKETLGGNYVSFDPGDVQDITNKLGNDPSTTPSEKRNALLDKFSFDTMTHDTVDLYHTLI